MDPRSKTDMIIIVMGSYSNYMLNKLLPSVFPIMSKNSWLFETRVDIAEP